MGWTVFDTVTGWGEGEYSGVASDNDLDSYADRIEGHPWLIFELSTPKYVTKARMYLDGEDPPVATVEAYYGGSWHEIYNNESSPRQTWIEFDVNQTISSLRYKDDQSSSWSHVHEVQYLLMEMAVKPLVAGPLAESSLAGGLLAR